MARFSTNLRTFVAGRGSYRQALQGGRMVIYSGSAPTSPDDAATGTSLCEIVNNDGGAWVSEIRATVIILVTVTGTCTGITVGGIPICGAVTMGGTTATDAIAIAAAINKFQGGIPCTATVSGSTVTVFAPAGSGTGFNGLNTVVSGTVTVTINGGSSITMGGAGATAGVAHTYGLPWEEAASGVMAKSGTWSGTIDNTGTAGYFRIIGNKDALGNPFVVQGSCGTSGADYNMASTALTLSLVHTVNNFNITLPVGS